MKAGIILNLVFIVVEILFGFLANSMALISDAAHNFGDTLALGFSWLAILLSLRKPSVKFTYGFRRSTILVALLNTVILLGSVIFIGFETIRRLSVAVKINSLTVIIVASAGILVNGITAWIFSRVRGQDLNIRSVFIHFLADTLISAGVVLSGILVAVTDLHWIDSVVSLIIVAVILYTTYSLLIRTINLALDAVPDHIDINAVKKYLQELPEVDGVHDLHIWALGTSDTAITVHLATNVQTDSDFIKEIKNHLHRKFAIGHTTIQVEYGNPPGGCNDCN